MPRSAPDRPDLAGRDTAHQEHAEFPVLRKKPVGLAKTGCRPDLRGFLTAARRDERDLALALQVDEFGVEFAGDDHHFV